MFRWMDKSISRMESFPVLPRLVPTKILRTHSLLWMGMCSCRPVSGVFQQDSGSCHTVDLLQELDKEFKVLAKRCAGQTNPTFRFTGLRLTSWCQFLMEDLVKSMPWWITNVLEAQGGPILRYSDIFVIWLISGAEVYSGHIQRDHITSYERWKILQNVFTREVIKVDSFSISFLSNRSRVQVLNSTSLLTWRSSVFLIRAGRTVCSFCSGLYSLFSLLSHAVHWGQYRKTASTNTAQIVCLLMDRTKPH